MKFGTQTPNEFRRRVAQGKIEIMQIQNSGRPPYSKLFFGCTSASYFLMFSFVSLVLSPRLSQHPSLAPRF